MADAMPPPTWFPTDGPCPMCKDAREAKDILLADRRARACDDCGAAIPVYTGMGGNGYESATVGHYHVEPAGSATLRVPVMRELCRACYLTDYAVMFPGATLPELK